MAGSSGWRAAAEVLGHVAAALSAFVVALVAWLSVIALVPAVIGWTPYVITSGSMGPRIPAGTVLVAGPPPDAQVAEGGVVVFTDERGATVTHRVVEVAGGRYRTKGDANALPDSAPVDHGQLQGVGRIVVPLLGLPVVWVLEGRWWLTVVALGVVMAAAGACAASLRRSRREQADPSEADARGGEPREAATRTAARRAVPAGLGAVLVAAVTALGAAATLAGATFAAEAHQPANRWQASERFDPPVATAVTASDLPRATASASQAFTFTFASDLPGGATVVIDLTEPYRGPVGYRSAAQPVASTGQAVLDLRRGQSPLREADITWRAPASGLTAGTTVTITVPAGIETADVVTDGLQVTFTREGADPLVALFSVR